MLLVGFIAYGLSIYFYVYAQRLLGAARTSAYYAISPFIAAILSLIIFKQIPTVYSRYPVIDYIQANSYDYLFYSINFYGNRCLAFFKRQQKLNKR